MSLGALAVTAALLAAGQGESLQDPSQCQRLFHEGQLDHPTLHVIYRGKGKVTLAHSGRYRLAPAPGRVQGIALVDADARHAIFEVKEPIEGCAEGLYELDVGDAIGGASTVVLTLDGIAVLEHEGRLYYLRAPEAERPDWSLVWQSSFTMNGYLGPKRASGRSRATPRRTPARSKPRTARKR